MVTISVWMIASCASTQSFTIAVDDIDEFDVSTPVVIAFEYWNFVPGACLSLSVIIRSEEGYPIFNTGSAQDPAWSDRPYPVGLFRSLFYIPADLLNDGAHRVHLYIARNQSEALLSSEDLLVFDVQDAPGRRSGWYGKWVGAVRPNLEWRTEQLAEHGGDDAHR